MSDTPRKPPAPVLIELDEGQGASPDQAPPIPDHEDEAPRGQAMQTAAVLAARRGSRLAKWFWSLLLALVGIVVSATAWNFATGLIAATPWLGWLVSALIAAFVLVALAIVVKEATAFARLSRVDRLHEMAQEALATEDLAKARAHAKALAALYAGRADLKWGLARMAERRDEQLDATSLLMLSETELLAPLDRAARAEAEAAARQVATVTALVPLAFADVIAALSANIRMIRRIAEIYGGRSGTLGSLRLLRAVMTHLVATGAVAVGDDLVHSVLGGTLLARLSRRFGEGVVNGALTARVGVAAMEVCRPMPFSPSRRPKVGQVIQRALTGLFGPKES
ncbi:YcjF family protein [Pseudooceanicola sp. CBS1P-1]|uniref:TIGR01620 family protein n=1 Tax=Pseudooceanicola albus TaxID=2692189 RepID=A0A6L7G7D4_9RHOB|nr:MULTISPECIES: TIGR01620 family protein [Pseudooceanicola]MBT9383128.1 YcjF family protein [Pseudooceanicola endophyticus]MXN19316.1 TIGR01620 family protein [Pseudooceanicola albus]